MDSVALWYESMSDPNLPSAQVFDFGVAFPDLLFPTVQLAKINIYIILNTNANTIGSKEEKYISIYFSIVMRNLEF